MSGETSIRQAEVDDAAAVLEMERSCVEAPHWSEGVWAQILAQPSGYSPYGAPPYGARRICFVAEQAEEIIGFVVIGIVGFSGAGQGVAEMESLVVHNDARRRGVGRSLCLHAVYWSQAMGTQQLQLEVRSASVAALALYRSLGFMEQGRRRGYYADPEDDAVLMALSLTSTRD
jgi:ribosomal-protein-alanine N-acetyltransferase